MHTCTSPVPRRRCCTGAARAGPRAAHGHGAVCCCCGAVDAERSRALTATTSAPTAAEGAVARGTGLASRRVRAAEFSARFACLKKSNATNLEQASVERRAAAVGGPRAPRVGTEGQPLPRSHARDERVVRISNNFTVSFSRTVNQCFTLPKQPTYDTPGALGPPTGTHTSRETHGGSRETRGSRASKRTCSSSARPRA